MSASVVEGKGLDKVHETGRWAHINVKLLHLGFAYNLAKNGPIFKPLEAGFASYNLKAPPGGLL